MVGHPRLGTRGSPLALAQARKVASAIEVAQHWEAGHIEIVPIKTSGDRIKDRPLAEVGGKGLWTKELDKALLDGSVDFTVHSLKDVESERPKAIRLAAIRPRGDYRERLIGPDSIEAIEKGATFGTSSPRRAAQMLAIRPDLKIVTLRGNVETRLDKVERGEVDATLLSSAGLRRLGLANVGTPVPVDVLLPAPGQAAIGIECRSDDDMTLRMLQTIDDAATHAAVAAERAFTRALGASCSSPVAALAMLERGKLRLRAELYSADGTGKVQGEERFDCWDLKAPAEFARAMLKDAPDKVRELFSGA
ncbi:MAG TPA: hydroxymethylbilane synthase [Sphingomicrobium sp.]|nr:hydroxymethylbilane synthase [Sphingomicrobium sp.]